MRADSFVLFRAAMIAECIRRLYPTKVTMERVDASLFPSADGAPRACRVCIRLRKHCVCVRHTPHAAPASRAAPNLTPIPISNGDSDPQARARDHRMPEYFPLRKGLDGARAIDADAHSKRMLQCEISRKIRV